MDADLATATALYVRTDDPRARKERRFVDDMVFPFEEMVGQAP